LEKKRESGNTGEEKLGKIRLSPTHSESKGNRRPAEGEEKEEEPLGGRKNPLDMIENEEER